MSLARLIAKALRKRPGELVLFSCPIQMIQQKTLTRILDSASFALHSGKSISPLAISQIRSYLSGRTQLSGNYFGLILHAQNDEELTSLLHVNELSEIGTTICIPFERITDSKGDHQGDPTALTWTTTHMAIAAGFEIGCSLVNSDLLLSLDSSRRRTELSKLRRLTESHLQNRVHAVSYPPQNDQRVIQDLAAAGYSVGLVAGSGRNFLHDLSPLTLCYRTIN